MSLPPDREDIGARFDQLAHQLVGDIVKPLDFEGRLDSGEIVRSLVAGLAQDGERCLDIQRRYYERQLALWRELGPAAADAPASTADATPLTDRRFSSDGWRQHPFFQYLARSYLLAGECLMSLVDCAKLEQHAKRRIEFLARQYVDAMSPANFPWSNPEALKLAADTAGESLARGLRHLAADSAKGMISMTDETAFAVGRNLAMTPGAVVFENDLIQLIQYRPSTPTVFERPLLMVPPCINKYYILDLQPGNSFVRYAVGAGHTVFMVSWRNVPAGMGTVTWDDYVERGVIRGIEAATDICGVEAINTLGFCVGGTLLGCAGAVLAGRGLKRVASITLLASMLDFSDTGELGVFVDEAFVQNRERGFAAGGILPGRELALTFASLRANDLIWNYVVNNYLLGRQPAPFDLLYWNSDSTNLPGAMYAYYLRNMYLENKLRHPGALTMGGVPVDLRSLSQPAYVLATRDDHIVPWKTAYASTRLLAGKIRFVLAASGHIAGVINPASTNRRNYWLNDEVGDDPDRWLAGATSHPGSWWPHWRDWIAAQSGARTHPRDIAALGPYRALEPAPGRYVVEQCS